TARSTTLPRNTNCRNPLSMPASRSAGILARKEMPPPGSGGTLPMSGSDRGFVLLGILVEFQLTVFRAKVDCLALVFRSVQGACFINFHVANRILGHDFPPRFLDGLVFGEDGLRQKNA